MLTLKWKIYKILNYVLLIYASLIVVLIFISLFGQKDNYEFFGLYMALIPFLFIIFKSIVNLVILSKNFPDKLLMNPIFSWHIVAIITSFLSFIFILLFVIIIFQEEIENFNKTGSYGGLFAISIGAVFCLLDGFVLFRQLTVKSYLKKNSSQLMNSLIESIGKIN